MDYLISESYRLWWWWIKNWIDKAY